MSRKLMHGRHPVRHISLVIVTMIALASCDAGWINPFVGNGSAGTTNATVPNAQAQFTYPAGVAARHSDGFYVYDTNACAIYKEASGQTSLFAGTPGTCGNSGDGGAATAATLASDAAASGGTPAHGAGGDLSSQLAVGPDGSVYFAQSQVVGAVAMPGSGTIPVYTSQIRRVTPDGTITTVGTPIVQSAVTFFTAVTVTPSGTILANVLQATNTSSTIYRINTDGTQTAVTTIAKNIISIAAISDTQIAATDFNALWRIDLGTGVATATGYSGGYLGTCIAAAPDGTIYVGSTSTNNVVRIDPDNSMTTIAGTGTADSGTTPQSGNGLDIDLTPTGLALTPNDGLLISSGHVVYRLASPQTAGASGAGL